MKFFDEKNKQKNLPPKDGFHFIYRILYPYESREHKRITLMNVIRTDIGRQQQRERQTAIE